MKRILLSLFLMNAVQSADIVTVDPTGSVIISGTAPANPAGGEVRIGAGQVKAQSTVTAGDVVINRTAQASSTQAVRGDDPRLAPTGMITPFAGSAAPGGWLLCNGLAVSRTSYSTLFATIGTTFGAGDGSTTFNLPDLRGRIVIGVGTGEGEGASGSGTPTGTTLTARSLGQFGGEEKHTLTVGELPPHDHKLVANTTNARTVGAPGATDSIVRGTIGGADEEYTMTKPTTPTPATLGQSSTVGSGTPHNNMQPFVVLNYLIKH